MKKLLIFLAFAFVFTGVAVAQGAVGDIKVTIVDDFGDPASFTSIVVLKDGVPVRTETSDLNGSALVKGLPVGTYDLKFTLIGYQTQTIKGIKVENGTVKFQNVKLSSAVTDIKETVITARQELIKPGETSVTTSFGREEIKRLPKRDAGSIATLSPGVFSRDGEVGNFLGSRQAATVMIDGVKVRGGSGGLPQGSVEEVQVVLGGVPAEYGDAVGGLILITTRSLPQRYYFSAEARTSKFLDNWENYLFSATVGGPFIRKRMKDSTFKNIAGFTASIEGNYDGDPAPVQGGVWRIKEDARQRLLSEPLRLAEIGSGTRLNAEYLRMNDFEKIPARLNVASKYLNVQGKFDFQLSPNTLVTAGGYVNLSEGFGGRDEGTYDFSLMNWENNAQSQAVTYNVFGRITQRFKSRNDSVDGKPRKGGVKNAQVTLQVDYVKGLGLTQDRNHKTNFFDYGYIGRFDVHRTPAYIYGYDPKSQTTGFLYQGMRDTMVSFTPGLLNPSATAWTSQYYTFFDSPVGYYDQFSSIQNGGALLNGMSPRPAYNIWYNVGTQYNGYSKSDNNQFRVIGNGSFSIGDHDIKIGFEFEQRNDAAYSLSPVALWRAAYLLTNSHLGTIDTSKPILVYDPVTNVYRDTINYPALYIEDTAKTNSTGYKFGVGQRFFDWNLRQKLGLAVDGLDFVDVDKYDPSFYSLNMFSADELLNQGDNYVSYYGYDPYGNKLSGNPSFEDFFIERDQYGNYTRPIGAFRPVYMAGYISDKFTFKDIVFNVGVRVDRFDANQKVLKDRFSLYETNNAGLVRSQGGIGYDPQNVNPVNVPGNIGDNYVVYVNDQNNPTQILGYRNGNTWYNADGEVVNDPAILRTSTGRVQPFMVNPNDNIQSPGFNPISSFDDYKPQVNVMPRIAFSFPVSETVRFTAYYDILTQRPSGAVRLNPMDYFYWDNATYNSGGRIFNNPSLRPERTTSFSLGFNQTITPDLAVKISAFYRELRDMIAVVRMNEAYPRMYTSWDNIDFGTVKGLTLEFVMRKQNLLLNAGYTLQFADGTGSNNTSQLNLVNSGQPNLRTTIPLSYDRRHNITAYVVYSFDDKVSRNKVVKAILQNLGASLQLNGGSGVPYSRQSNYTGTGFISGAGQASLLGSVNGARLPWEFRADLKIFKDIRVKFGKKPGEGQTDSRKSANLGIYLDVLNLFGTVNTISVYAATGTANDDGYLTAPQFQTFIDGQIDAQSFRDLYSMQVNDPRNLSMPRVVRLGVQLQF